MIAMSSAVRISCALVVVTMAICSATTVAISESTSAGVAVTTLHSPHAPAAIKRHLKRTTTMKATETSEERANSFQVPEMDSILTSLKSIPEAIYQKLPGRVWWLTWNNSDRKFQRLGLNNLDTEKRKKLFEDPRFMDWITSIKEEYSNPLEVTETMLETLVRYYGEGVELTDMLVAGTKTAGVKKDIASKLLSLQFSKWKESKKTADDVLTFLRLKNEKNELFKSPLFLQWVSFVKLRHPNDNEAAMEDILSTLRKNYHEDAAMADVLVAGTKTAGVKKDIASKLLSLQFSKWKRSEKTADDVFTFLRLKNEKNELFNSPLFLQWVSFVKLRHPNDNEAAMEDILSTLRDNYREDAALADVLVAGSKISNTQALALDILKKQFGKWLETGNSVKEVFTFLRLEHEKNQLFKSPLLLQWVSFVKLRHPNDNEAAMEDILSTLKDHYNNDAALADVLVAGSKISNTQALALDLLKIELDKWLKDGKTVEEVFTYLKLKELRDGLFKHPSFDLWLKFYGQHSKSNEYKAYRSAEETYKKRSDEAQKAAEATQTAHEVDKPDLQKVEKLAAEKAKEAKVAVDGALVTMINAYQPHFKRLLSILRKQISNDEQLRKILDNGSKVSNEFVKEHAKIMLNMFKMTLSKES